MRKIKQLKMPACYKEENEDGLLSEYKNKWVDFNKIKNYPKQEEILKYISDYLQMDKAFRKECDACKNEDTYVAKLTYLREIIEPIANQALLETLDTYITRGKERFHLFNLNLFSFHYTLELYLIELKYNPVLYNMDKFCE